MCRTEAKGLLPQMITAVAVANDRVGTVHDGSAESVHKPNDSQPTATSRRSIFAKLSGSQTVTHEPDEHTFLMAPTEEANPPEVFRAKSGDAYPRLIKPPRTFLSIPASSGRAERLFSVALCYRSCTSYSKLSSVAVESLLLAKENH